MNIFLLDDDIERCAQYHCDQHVGKMILESVQILCTALNLRDIKTPYRSTHRHHPCVKWAGESYDNFIWLTELSKALNREFCWRYEREQSHASMQVLACIEKHQFESKGLTPFAQAMPEQYKVAGDPVTAYRAFYCAEKSSFARWKKRAIPPWFAAGEKLAPPIK